MTPLPNDLLDAGLIAFQAVLVAKMSQFVVKALVGAHPRYVQRLGLFIMWAIALSCIVTAVNLVVQRGVSAGSVFILACFAWITVVTFQAGLRILVARTAIYPSVDSNQNNVVWIEGDQLEPVTADDPLVGLETLVLKVWLDESLLLRKAYESNQNDRVHIENAVRHAVENTRVEELHLRAGGMSLEEAQSITKPLMWRPPRW